MGQGELDYELITPSARIATAHMVVEQSVFNDCSD